MHSRLGWTQPKVRAEAEKPASQHEGRYRSAALRSRINAAELCGHIRYRISHAGLVWGIGESEGENSALINVEVELKINPIGINSRLG
jgi:hypothetical protein